MLSEREKIILKIKFYVLLVKKKREIKIFLKKLIFDDFLFSFSKHMSLQKYVNTGFQVPPSGISTSRLELITANLIKVRPISSLALYIKTTFPPLKVISSAIFKARTMKILEFLVLSCLAAGAAAQVWCPNPPGEV